MFSASDAALSICVVDDDAAVCGTVCLMLERHSFAVLAFSSAVQLLAVGLPSQARCLVIDQHMPGMTGLDAVAALHRDGRLPPTVLITGRPDTDILRRADELGVRAVLQKPFRAAQLVAAVEGAIGGR